MDLSKLTVLAERGNDKTWLQRVTGCVVQLDSKRSEQKLKEPDHYEPVMNSDFSGRKKHGKNPKRRDGKEQFRCPLTKCSHIFGTGLRLELLKSNSKLPSQ